MRQIHIIAILALILLVMPLSYADSPFIIPANRSFQIIPITNGHLPQNATLRFAVYNETAYVTFPNCSIYLYDYNGHVLYSDYLQKNIVDYSINYYFNESGQYFYNVNCNKGLASLVGSFFILKDGYNDNIIGGVPLALLISLPLFFSLLLIFGAFSLSFEHTPLRIALFLLSFPPLFASFNLGAQAIIRFYNWVDFENTFIYTFRWMGLIYAVIIIYFIIYLIYKIFSTKKIGEIQELEY
jgi:hypothetical protein